MKPTGNLVLALTFVEKWMDTYQLVSANIGKRINEKFIIVKILKVNQNLLNNNEIHEQMIKEFQDYLNSRWNNKGMLLMDIRDDNALSTYLSKLLVNAHKAVKNEISEIVCGIAPKEEFEAYKLSIIEMEKKKKEIKEDEVKNKKIHTHIDYC